MADWSRAEVDLIVADYFAMLRCDLFGTPYSKTDHREALSPLLDDRSKGSIEFKHQNISAVMVTLGLPYIDGYKPRGNFQSLLADAVSEYLAAHPGELEMLANAPRLNPERLPPAPILFNTVEESPPERLIVPREQSRPWISRKGRMIDFAARDASNRRLAKLGEQWVVSAERQRLTHAGRDDLAAKVDHVSVTIGDGLGFDVLSFDHQDDSERLIEVKTTGLGKDFPFYVTRNEVRCSDEMDQQFHLYRVFNFGPDTRLYVLRGSLQRTCQLEPVQYRAKL